MTRKTKLF